MKVLWIAQSEWLSEIRDNLGYEIVESDPDLIIGMSVIDMPRIWQAHQKYPNAKLINYNWDIYEWVWKRPRRGEYDYRRYVELLKKSDEVWVPSEAEQARSQRLGIQAVVIPTFVPVFDMEVNDGGYILNPLREVPDDHHGWFEQACDELGLPYISNKDHQYPYETYKSIIADCRFLCSPYRETSTGGLDIMKGYHLGKPSLVYEGSGARTYLGDNATYFSDYKDMKAKLKKMYYALPVWVTKLDFSVKKMCNLMSQRMEELRA